MEKPKIFPTEIISKILFNFIPIFFELFFFKIIHWLLLKFHKEFLWRKFRMHRFSNFFVNFFMRGLQKIFQIYFLKFIGRNGKFFKNSIINICKDSFKYSPRMYLIFFRDCFRDSSSDFFKNLSSNFFKKLLKNSNGLL